MGIIFILQNIIIIILYVYIYHSVMAIWRLYNAYRLENMNGMS